MATRKQRSPSYPAIDLEDAVNKARQIHKACRESAVDRDSLATIIGLSPRSGGAMRAIASLVSYGLLQSGAKKGEVGLAPLAMEFMFGETNVERGEAARQAALNPSIFKTLAEKFTADTPQGTVEAYLCRNLFTADAAKRAAATYARTMKFAGLVYASNRSDTGTATRQDLPESTDGSAVEKPEGSDAMPITETRTRSGDLVDVLRFSMGSKQYRILAQAPPSAREWEGVIDHIKVNMRYAEGSTPADGDEPEATE